MKNHEPNREPKGNTQNATHTPGCKPGWRITGCDECERLIAAAPELLEALKECLHEYEIARKELHELEHGTSQEDAKRAVFIKHLCRNAIAKAEGR